MAKYTHPDVVQAGLDDIRSGATRLCVCTQQPTTHTQALSTYALAVATISSANISAPSAGSPNGRKVTVGAVNNISVTTSGTPGHIALVDFANNKLLNVTTCTGPDLTSGSTVNVPAYDISFADPS
jgi:hypothetical protein